MNMTKVLGKGLQMEKIKIVLATGLGAFLAVFAIQNMAPVQLTILLWTFESRRIVVIGVSFIVGLAIGWTVHALRKRLNAKSTKRFGSADT
jgi:uncharacterized integral membrane protein